MRPVPLAVVTAAAVVVVVVLNVVELAAVVTTAPLLVDALLVESGVAIEVLTLLKEEAELALFEVALREEVLTLPVVPVRMGPVSLPVPTSTLGVVEEEEELAVFDAKPVVLEQGQV